MSCGCGSCMFVEYGGGATGVDSTEHDTAPAPPAPAEPRKGSKAWAINEACRIVGIAYRGIGEYDEASDCFCSASPDADYRNGGRALAFVEAAVKEKLAREKSPAPEAKGEMSPPHGIRCESCLAGAPHERDRHCYSVAQLMEHIAALRTRAREAEEREAKWRRELSAACELSERAREIVVSALNQPPEHYYDKHDNGEWSAEHIAFAIRSLFGERDEAREQRDAIRKHSEGLAHDLGKADGDRMTAFVALDTERAARLRAEAERDEAKTAAFYAFVAGSKWWEFAKTGATMWTGDVREAEEAAQERYPYAPHGLVREAEIRAKQAEERLAAAEAETTRLRVLFLDVERERNTLRASIARLVEAGDAMVHTECYDWPGHVARWLAAKADAPAAKETK